jgi:hypothetical protein
VHHFQRMLLNCKLLSMRKYPSSCVSIHAG